MFRWLFSSSDRARKPRSRPVVTFRPTLEVLESRYVPAAKVGGLLLANLISNQAGVAAVTDPNLVNAWGMSLNPAGGGTFWVSAHGTGVSTVYTGDVNGSPVLINDLVVTIPGGSPTGQVFNATADFVVRTPAGTQAGRAIFIFASDTGFITGWNPAVGVPPGPPSRIAQIGVNRAGVSFYTGLALANNGVGNHLYAADFRAGTIDVFNGTFQPVTLAGSFVDPDLKPNFKPFNIQNLGGELYVTYARDSNDDGIPNGGNGFVSVFDTNGNFLRRIASGGQLNQPWGLALAPGNFGPYSNTLLVANHGNGKIHAFNPQTGELVGVLRDTQNKPIQIDGLWGLTFGNGGSFGDRNALYFSAGPDDGANGLIGSLRVVS